MSEAFEPISLGYSCEVKYQLSRALFLRKHPEADDFDLRRMLLTHEYGQQSFERHVFDWQITPFPAVLEYLERDFQGVFERKDLVINGGEVIHRHLQTRHPHDFKPVGGKLNEAAIDAAYTNARSKFEHLASKFRALLKRPGRYLYVGRQIRSHNDAVRLIELLGAHHPEHQFKLLFVGEPGDDQMLGALEGQVFKAWAPLRGGKTADRRWEGDDASWDPILADWPLTVHGGDRITRTFAEIPR
jgi:hypothetical protein